MKRWLVLVMLLSACAGCIIVDEPPAMPSMFGPPPTWLTQGSTGPPPSSCFAPSSVSMTQTAEPEMLQTK